MTRTFYKPTLLIFGVVLLIYLFVVMVPTAEATSQWGSVNITDAPSQLNAAPGESVTFSVTASYGSNNHSHPDDLTNVCLVGEPEYTGQYQRFLYNGVWKAAGDWGWNSPTPGGGTAVEGEVTGENCPLGPSDSRTATDFDHGEGSGGTTQTWTFTAPPTPGSYQITVTTRDHEVHEDVYTAPTAMQKSPYFQEEGLTSLLNFFSTTLTLASTHSIQPCVGCGDGGDDGGGSACNCPTTSYTLGSTPDTITIPLEVVELTASCDVVPSTVGTGDSVTWSSSVTDGTSPYSYSWNLEGATNANTQDVTRSYFSSGTYDGTVTITDDAGNTDSATCSVTVVNDEPAPDPLTGSCSVSPSTAETGDSVTWSSEATDGTSPYSYSWNLEGATNANTQDVTRSYSSSGTYDGTVTITDDASNSVTDTCTVTINEPTTPNNPPNAVDDGDETADICVDGDPVFNVVANDSDPDGDSIAISSVQNITDQGGTAVKLNDEEIDYTPPSSSFTGTDTFTYTISDGNGGTDSAQVTVDVQGQSGGCGTITVRLEDTSGSVVSGADATPIYDSSFLPTASGERTYNVELAQTARLAEMLLNNIDPPPGYEFQASPIDKVTDSPDGYPTDNQRSELGLDY